MRQTEERYISLLTDFGFCDIKNSLDSAEEKGRADGLAEGMARGLAEGKAGVARKLLAMGMSADSIAEATGLTPDKINSL